MSYCCIRPPSTNTVRTVIKDESFQDEIRTQIAKDENHTRFNQMHSGKFLPYRDYVSETKGVAFLAFTGSHQSYPLQYNTSGTGNTKQINQNMN